MTKKKTIIQWISELDPKQYPWKYQALRNMSPGGHYDECSSLRVAVMSAFIWIDTPEGNTFWKNIHRNL